MKSLITFLHLGNHRSCRAYAISCGLGVPHGLCFMPFMLCPDLPANSRQHAVNQKRLDTEERNLESIHWLGTS
jgi:hypothetical protein